jgi:hypothetical protein
LLHNGDDCISFALMIPRFIGSTLTEHFCDGPISDSDTTFVDAANYGFDLDESLRRVHVAEYRPSFNAKSMNVIVQQHSSA